MNLEEFYAQIGGDYADTLQRLCNENMVKKFVKKYQDDPTCADLHNAVLQQDWEAAFRGAHTLKGVAQNLGFERLYQVSAVLTEAMRGEKPLEDRSLLDAVEVADIVTPTLYHYECACKAIEKGCHVFLEKPVTTTLEQAEYLIRRLHEKGLKG